MKSSKVSQHISFKSLFFSPSFRYIFSLKDLNKNYQKEYELSIQDFNREKFWLSQSLSLSWFKKPTQVISTDRSIEGTKGDRVLTYTDGQINLCYNCLDRHMMPHKNNAAIIYAKSPISYESISYLDLFTKVNSLAHHLQAYYNLKPNDNVLIYLPHVPEAIYSILACSRLGIVYSIAPSTLDAKTLSQKINHLNPKLIITTQEIRPPVDYLVTLKTAFDEASISNVKTLIFKSDDSSKKSEGVKFKGPADLYDPLTVKYTSIDCVPLNSGHPLTRIETSGTEGVARGFLRDTAGFAVYLSSLMKNTFDFESRNVFFCAPGFSWAYGQNYGLFGPLLVGGTTFLYDGDWNDPEIYWKLLSHYKINSFLTFPRYIEPAKKADYNGKNLESYDLSALKTFILTGEHCKGNTFNWLKNHMTSSVRLYDTYMQQESGFPIFHSEGGNPKLGLGFDVILAQKEDADIKSGTHMGQILLTLPLPPGCVGNSQKIFNQEIAIENKGKYYRTGDAGFINDLGKVEVSREEDIITVGDTEFSTSLMEEVLSLHRFVNKISIVPGLMRKEEGFCRVSLKKKVYVPGKGLAWK